MSTATTTVRPPITQAARPAAAPVHAAISAFGTVDPVRLLRRYYPWVFVAAVAGAIAGVAAHFVLAAVYPVYTSTATFICKTPTSDFKFINQNAIGQDEFTRFIGTQAAFMTSARVLERAVQDPDLERSIWARQFVGKGGQIQPADAQAALRKRLSARPRTNTNLVDLSMSFSDAEAIRTIVDAVAKAYMDEYRRDNSQESVARRDSLNKQISTLDQLIRSAQDSRDRQMLENKMTDMKEGGATEDVQTYRLNDTLVAINRDLATTGSLLQRYESQLAENAVITYPEEMRSDAKRDPILGQLENQITQFRAEERSLMTRGFGAEHDAVITLRKRIEGAQQEQQEVEQRILRKLFDAEIDRLRTQKDALNRQHDELTTQLVTVSQRKEDLNRLRVRLEQIDRDVQRYNLERTDLVNARNNIEQLLSQDVYSRVSMIQPAQRPSEMSFPQLKILVPLGIVLGLGLVGGGLLLRELLDQRVKGPADVAMIPRVRVLGMVTDASEDPVKAASIETAFRDAPQGVVSESFRQLRAPLMKKMDQEGYRTLLVLAGMPGSGATTVVCNLALASAGAGDRVLIIDANLRRPAIHRIFGLSDSPGLGDCLVGKSSLADATRATNVENLFVVAAGSPENRLVPERLGSDAMNRLLAEAASRFDRVIIDAPPAIVSGDGMTLANRCDAVALVVRALNEKRGLVNRLRIQLGEVRGEMIGVIVNAVRSSAGGYFKKNIQATHEYQTAAR